MHKNSRFLCSKNGLKLTKIVHIAQITTDEICVQCDFRGGITSDKKVANYRGRIKRF